MQPWRDINRLCAQKRCLNLVLIDFNNELTNYLKSSYKNNRLLSHLKSNFKHFRLHRRYIFVKMTTPSNKKRTRLIIIVIIVGCIILGLIIWACVHHLTKTTPLLTFAPDDGGTLIKYTSAHPNSYSYWTQKLDTFLKPYVTPGLQEFVNCEQGVPPEARSNQVCAVDYPKSYSRCTREYNYNYQKSTPCVFLVFNTPPDWQPEYYNSSTLPDNMPTSLKNNILNRTNQEQRTIWVSCEGETAIDKEFMGPVQFLPKQGFDGQYFPIVNKEFYVKPLVAIYFEKPGDSIVINTECKAWAKNLNHEKGEGVVHFQLMIE